MKNLTIYVLFILCGVLFLAYMGKEAPVQTIVVEKPVPMSIRELQTFLNEQDDPWKRYVCSVDSVYGRETERALENWLCDSNAKKYFPTNK